MRKRSVNICAGESPLSISTLVDTKVQPHIATVAKATRWYIHVLLRAMTVNGV